MVYKFSRPVVLASIAGTFVGAAFLLRDYFGGKRFSGGNDVENKVVIVTGANAGIGKETARELAKRKAKVYMVCRDMTRCEKAREEIVLESKNKFVYCRMCDLSSQQSIRKFVEQFKKEECKLDILINNAGVYHCPESKTKEGIETHLGVNHMGHFLLTNLLLKLLKDSAPSRIINVSSTAHRWGKIDKMDLNLEKNYTPRTAYAQSKLANILFTDELAKRLKGTGVTVNSLHPGLVDTGLLRNMSFANSFTRFILKPLTWVILKTPVQGAQTTLYAALDSGLENVTGKYFSDCEEAKVAEQARDELTAAWLWEVSLKWTKLEASETI